MQESVPLGLHLGTVATPTTMATHLLWLHTYCGYTPTVATPTVLVLPLTLMALAGSWNSPSHQSGAASPRYTPRSLSMPPRSGIKHSDNDRSVTNKSPATLRLSDLTRKPKPMSQYVMANPFSKRDAPVAAPAPRPAPSARPASTSRPSGKQPMTAEQLAQVRAEQLQQLRAARREQASGKQPLTAEQLTQLRKAAAVHKNSAYSADAELAQIPAFRRQRSGGRSRQERTYDTLPQMNPPPRTYETLTKHAAPSRALPPPSDSSDGLLYSGAHGLLYRPESPLPPGAFSA